VQIETEKATSSTRADLAVRIEDNAHNQGIDRVEMRAARETNATEHRAFTQNIQTLLAEIAHLWQRVAG
jgi:hypothetical protein